MCPTQELQLVQLVLQVAHDGIEACGLKRLQLVLQGLILFLELVEVSWLMSSSLEKANDEVINRLDLIVVEALVSQCWLSLI